jgi:hypothetical protein
MAGCSRRLGVKLQGARLGLVDDPVQVGRPGRVRLGDRVPVRELPGGQQLALGGEPLLSEPQRLAEPISRVDKPSSVSSATASRRLLDQRQLLPGA